MTVPDLGDASSKTSCTVVSPWHGSTFALDDGAVINGPATQNQPVFEVHEADGRVAVKAG
jgi:nitrite reductase/ring-hydroxylating ferredoxin subunit